MVCTLIESNIEFVSRDKNKKVHKNQRIFISQDFRYFQIADSDDAIGNQDLKLIGFYKLDNFFESLPICS